MEPLSKIQKESWVDVVPLSEKLCQHPIQGDLKYAGSENFLGRPVAGYAPDARDVCLLLKEPGLALCKVQDHLNPKGLGLLIFDSYRPLRAVKDFAQWMQAPVANPNELYRKSLHYPHLEKNQLTLMGYVADTVSNHCSGATVDLTLLELSSGKPLNMGAEFDYFDELSHPSRTADEIGLEAYQNRKTLIESMELHGFKVYYEEFWHFDFQTKIDLITMDFEITSDLRGTGCKLKTS